MRTIEAFLRHQGYNLRERFNVYAGPAVAVLYSEAFLRYMIGDNISSEPIAWSLIQILNLPFVMPELTIGIGAGFLSAKSLQINREDSIYCSKRGS